MQDKNINIYIEFMDKVKRIRKIVSQSYREKGYSVREFWIFKSMSSDESIPVSELAKRTGKPKSNLTVILDGLENKGIIIRVNDKDDRRIVRVEYTKKGKAEQKKVMQDYYSKIGLLFKDTPYEFENMLLKCIDIFDGIIGKGEKRLE